MHVTNTIFSTGERRPLIINDDGSIDFWSTLFVTVELRSDGKQNTIRDALYAIVHLRKWEQISRRDLFEEFRRQQFPDTRTVQSIKAHCGLSSRALDRKPKKVVDITRLAKIESPLDTVRKEYQYQRMMRINQFLKFCAWEICKFKLNASDLLNQVEGMESLFKSNYPKGLSNLSRVTHAEADEFEYFRQVVRPEHPKNPFKNYPLKFRNYLLVEILYWTGCRPSEVLSLTLNNINHDKDQPALFFERRHDDPADPRKIQPTLKTQEREIQIPPALYTDLEYYNRHIRTMYEASKTHPYIFVSQKGQTSGLPMTDKAFSDKVLRPLKHVDGRFENIQRRGFRIYFNERFSNQIDMVNEEIRKQIQEAEKNGEFEAAKELRRNLISEGDEINARQIVMGHSSPDSARPYLDRHVERKANKVHKLMMQDVSAAVKEIKDARDGK
jgi:integrase